MRLFDEDEDDKEKKEAPEPQSSPVAQALFESREVVTARADGSGGDLGIGEQGLCFRFFEQRHGDVSLHQYSMPSKITCCDGNLLQEM